MTNIIRIVTWNFKEFFHHLFWLQYDFGFILIEQDKSSDDELQPPYGGRK